MVVHRALRRSAREPRALSCLGGLALSLGLLACGDPSVGTAPEGVPDPPFITKAASTDPALADVVMIVVDTLRADHLGAYGSQRGLTPRIDALAERSHLFEHAVATSSWTRPSIASMLTSRFPTSLGLLDRTDSLQEAAVTLPELLRNQAGFQTFAVITNGNVSAQFGFDQGFDRFVSPHLWRLYPGDVPIQVAEGVTQKALDLVDRRDPRLPFFLFVLYVDPHDPYLPHPEVFPEPVPPGRFSGSRNELSKLDRLRLRAEPADYERIRHLYAGEVRYADHWIGELLDGLAERGLDEDLLILLTADHGEGLWDHGRRNHGNDLYEESVHVPLLVKLPGMTASDASRIASPVSLVDLAPTVLASAGVPTPPSFQGFDLQPLTRGESRGAPFDYVYTEMDYRNRSLEAIRHGSWKLIRDRDKAGGDDGAVEIYDLASDPAEERSRLNDAPPRVRRPLADSLERWGLAVLAHSADRRQVALTEMDRETLENLRALGYIGNAELEGALSAKRREAVGSNGAGAAPEDLPAVALSALDFTSPPGARVRAQIERGFSEVTAGSPGAVLAGEGTVLLRRQRGHASWRIETVVDSVESTPVAFTVQADADEPVNVVVHEPGSYLILGTLPAKAGRTVRLRLRCGDPGSAAPCATIRTIDLR